MLAYKTKPHNRPISRTTNIKRKKALSENAKQKLLGVAMILLAIPAMCITNEFGEPNSITKEPIYVGCNFGFIVYL